MYIRKLLLVVSLLGVVVLAVFSYFIYQAVFVANTAFEEEQTILFIPTGADYGVVRDSLRGKLKNNSRFDALAQQKGYTHNVKPGRYVLRKGMNNNAIINTLRSANNPISITFNNQERLENLAGRIAEQIEADSTALLRAMCDVTFLTEKGFNEETALSMYIPNTYEFYWNTSAKGFVERMYKEYSVFWNEERLHKAKSVGLSPVEVINLAAIVQKETAMVSERRRVAGVYINRLRRNMLLQADPTVIFSIKKESGDFNQVIKRVLYEDLNIDSPYNTYRYPGIPPGPIAMPDISSIDAVLNYESHDYLYFVADTERSGYHVFAKTLAQHNVNAAKYHRWVSLQGYER